MVGAGHAGAVAELLSDGEGLAVPVQGVVVVAMQVGDDAELVVGAGHAGAVAELLKDGEGFAVPVQGVVVVAPPVGQIAKRMLEGGGLLGSLRKEGEGLLKELRRPRPCAPGRKLLADRPGDRDRLVALASGLMVVAGLEELLDVGLAVLGPDLDTPAPVARCPPVRLGEVRRGGQPRELRGGPAVHQPSLSRNRDLLARLGRGDQAKAGHGLERLPQAVRDPQRRAGPRRHIRVELRALLLRQARRLHAGLLAGIPERCQRRLQAGQAGCALRVGGRVDLLADLPGKPKLVHRQPVDRRTLEQPAGQRLLVQPREQPLQEHVVGRQGDGLGQRLVEVPGDPGAPAGKVGDVAAGRQGSLEAAGDVVEAGLAAAEQRVQVLERARVAPDIDPHAAQLLGLQRIQGGQPPDQLPGLGQRQRPQVVRLQAQVGVPRQREGEAAGDQQAALPARLHPGCQELAELLVADHGRRRARMTVIGRQVVLEVVQQQHHRPLAEQIGEAGKAVAPVHLRVAHRHGQTAQRMPLVPSLRPAQAQQPLAQLVQDLVNRGLAERGDDQPGLLAKGGEQLSGEAALTDPADPMQHHASLPAGQGAAQQALVAAAPDEVADLADHHPGREPRLRRRRKLLDALLGIVERQRRAADEQRRGRPLTQGGEAGVAGAGAGGP